MGDMVNAKPVKAFFVEMLTRDITLDDAILDLIDNSLDGALRMQRRTSSSLKSCYDGRRVSVSIKKDSFTIEDNCGGIPYNTLVNYAFRMGRDPLSSDTSYPTVGTFGIGMKRAIFKMGRSCVLQTCSENAPSSEGEKWHEVRIDASWIENNEQWDIPLKECDNAMSAGEPGTKLCVTQLTESTRREFEGAHPSIVDRLRKTISETYAPIIGRGLQIAVNGVLVEPWEITLCSNGNFRPYMHAMEIDGVSILMMVGLTGPLLTEKDQDLSCNTEYGSSESSGWTVICNDRVVLFGDKSELTGWGELSVPKFHNQFMQISGVVFFECEDARRLPTTTTKRGVDANNPIYLEAKRRMREGTKKFTEFTNKWKKSHEKIRSVLQAAPRLAVTELRHVLISKMEKSGQKGRAFTELPLYPLPPKANKASNRFTVTIDPGHIADVADYLGLLDTSPTTTIESSFDYVYNKAVAQ